MSADVFGNPILLRNGTNIVHEISDVGDATFFLEQWPLNKRDMVHEVALNACYDVLSGLKPVEAARNAVIGFARRNDILFEDGEAVDTVMPTIAKGATGAQARTAA